MNQHQFSRGGQKALGGMIHAVKTMNALAIKTEQLGSNADGIMGDQLTRVIDMGFHDER